MTIARTSIAAIAAAASAGCATSDIAIRPVAGSQLPASATPSARVAEGHLKLVMGSVGLAIESFRRAIREDPASIDALEGMAMAYERLGRHDLASRQYEAALSIAPRNLILLQRLAASRDAEGKAQSAMAIRREIAFIRSADAAAEDAQIAVAAQAIEQDARLSLPVSERPGLQAVDSTLPRLVRLNLGEIALVTRPGPIWERSLQPPQRKTEATEIRLLNAARVDRLATRTRTLMRGAGWRNITVGDAPQVRAESVIRFPRHALTTVRRLAAQYGIHAELDPSAKFITVYLGSDSIGRVGPG